MCLRNLIHALEVAGDSSVTRNSNTLVKHIKLLDIGFVLHNKHGATVASAPFDDQVTEPSFTVGRARTEHRHSELPSTLSKRGSVAALDMPFEVASPIIMAGTGDDLVRIAGKM